MKENVCNLSLDELGNYLKGIGEKSFRADQVFNWIYQKNAKTFSGMRNLSKELQQRLDEDFEFKRQHVIEKQIAKDGTTKLLFELKDAEKIESVLIPTSRRSTGCISTQAGCKFGCKFCASGIGGLKRNLSCAEIIMQILQLKEESKQQPKPLSHIVFMGIGEPLDNFDNLMKAIRIINDPKAFNIGARRITVSTCGVIPNIKKLAREGMQIELAISLHGFNNQSRNVLMPVNRKYPFDDLMEACREYILATKRQITFEYILIKDVTCTFEAVKELKKAFKGLICKMNLIPYNPVNDFDHQTPTRQEIRAFQDQLRTFGIHATVRTPRGKDIAGACGQLRHSVEKP